MMTNGKYKISNFAKDLRMKNKDFLELLAKAGINGKTHSGTLDPNEFAVVMEYVTKENQMTDINSYIMGMTVIDDPSVVGICPPRDEKVEAAEKKAAPEKSSEAKKETKEQGAAKKQEEKKSEPAQKQAAQTKEVKSAGSPEKKAEQPAAQKKEKQQKAPVDRFANGPATNAPAKSSKKENKPVQNKNTNSSAKGTVTEIAIAVEGVENNTYKGNKSRVIDTRSSDVNLSKYDEKLENFTDTGSGSDEKYGRQKVKKQSKGQGQTQTQQTSNGKGGKN